MAIPLKYNTASQEVPLGYFLDSTDGDTEETGLTIANTDIKLWKSGATTLASKNSGGATHISNGIYYCVLDATDTNTYGPLVIFVHVSGALAIRVECVVMEADAYDALYAAAGTGHIEADTVQISGNATASDNLESACDNYSVTRGLAGTALPAAAADAAGGLPISDAGGLDLDTKLANTNEVTAARMSELDAATAGKMANQVDEIRTDTEDIQTQVGTAGAGLTAVPWNSAWDAEVESECNDALVAQKLDHLVAVADADDAVNDSIMAKLAASDGDWSGFDKATDSLEALRDRGDAAWITGAGGSDRLLMVDTTIATLASQTSFTLTAGSADDNAYNNCTIVIEDASTSAQKAVGLISDYTGGTKTVTLKYDPGIFTMAVSDKVYILAENALKSTVANRQLDVTATGAAGIDWANIENPTTAVDLSATDIQLCDTVSTVTGGATEAKQDTAQTDLDTITGTGGVLIGTDVMDRSGTLDVNTKTLTAAAIANATFNSDVGSTAYASNIIALAVRKVLDELNLDHLMKVATGTADMTTEIVDNSALSRILANGDTSAFVPSTDGLQPTRDHIGDGTNLTEAGGDGDHLTAINLPNQTMDITGDIIGNLSGSVGSVTGHTNQTADHTANISTLLTRLSAARAGYLDELAAANLPADIDAILADTGTDGVVVAASSKTGYSLSTAGIDAIWDEVITSGHTTVGSAALLLLRAFWLANQKLNVTDATGVAGLRNDGDSSDLATGSITDDDTTTVRGAWSWA